MNKKRASGSDFSLSWVKNPDLEYLIIDSTIVRAHQHAAGAQKGERR
jgi:hypothetical protein